MDIGSAIKKVQADAGDRVEIDCDQPDGRWSYIDKHGIERDVSDNDADDSLLILSNVNEGDEGVYSCRYLDHSVGIVKDSLKLEVRPSRGRKRVINLMAKQHQKHKID